MILLFVSLAAAQAVAPANAEPAAPVADKDPIVCQIIRRTGSRIARERVCRHASDWDLDAKRARGDTADIQRQSRPEQGLQF